MAEHDNGGKTASFLLGFLVGVLVCLGAGGTLFMTYYYRNAEKAQRIALEEAERAAMERARAEEALMIAREAEARARAAEEKAKAKDK